MAISDRISSIEEHLKESYQELEGIGIDTTGVNNNLENIPKLLDGYWETLPKVTDEGTSITLDNTKEGKMKINLKGNTSQNTTTGKNLVDFEHPNDTVGNTTYSFTDNTITVSGTSAYGSVIYRINDLLKNNAGKTIKFVCESADITNYNSTSSLLVQLYFKNNGSNNYKSLYIKSGDTTTDGSDNPFTIPNDTTNITDGVIRIYINNTGSSVSTTSTVSVTKPMLIFTTSSETPYEKYTGGQPSPNPSYPETVHVVSGYNTVKVEGKNLWSSEWEQGFIDGTTGANVYSTVFVRTKGYISVIPNQNYGITRSISSGYMNVRGYDINKNYIGAGGTVISLVSGESGSSASNPMQANGTRCVISIKEGVYYLRFNDNSNNLSTQYMMIKGNTAPTTYTPYISASYPINLPEGMFLGSIGDYKDRLFKTSGNNLIGLDAQQYVVDLKEGDKISLKNTSSSTKTLNLYTNYGDTTRNDYWTVNPNSTKTVTIAYDTKAIAWSSSSDGIFWVNKGDSILDYEPYGSNEWYLEKKIGKIVLNGTEQGWYQLDSNVPFRYSISNIVRPENNDTIPFLYCDYYKITSWNNNSSSNYVLSMTRSEDYLRFKNVDISTLADFKTWLSTHNTTVYYVLATPTYTKIEGTLASQLEALNGSKSYTPQTNISQNNNDMASLLNATALSNGTVTPSLQGVQTLSLGQNVDLQTQEPIEEQAEEVEEQGEEL